MALLGLGVSSLMVIRDLVTPGARLATLGVVPLALPVLFLFGMMLQWEGPLYVSVSPTQPQNFRAIGLSMFDGLTIYGPEHDNAEWTSDEIGTVWKFTWNQEKSCCPIEREFRYGEIPGGYVEEFPQHTATPSVVPRALDPNQTYVIEIDRGMGGPQYLSLRGTHVEENQNREFGPHVCWGQLDVAAKNAATIRVDCQTRKPLPMSSRAQERLKQYQDGKLDWY